MTSPLTTQAGAGAAITRTVLPGAAGPYASTVNVPPQARYVFTAGIVADVADPSAPKDSVASFGSAQVQTTSILNKLNALLVAEGMSLADAVKVTVYLVPDAVTGQLDFAGMNTAYAAFFGSDAQPAKAARTTIGVPVLPRRGATVEIEVVAARMP